MDLLTQAKQFLAKKASKLAMVAVPLAALAVVAVPAKATTVVLDPNGTDFCNAQFSGSCTLTPNATGGNTFINQVVLTGSATATISGGFANLSNSGSGTSNGGVLPVGSVPVTWNFAIAGNSGTVNWEVDFFLYFSGGGSDGFSLTGSTSGGTVMGSGAINVPVAEAISSYDIEVDANGSGSFSLSAPLTLNAQSSTPEPGSLLLIGAGGAALLIAKRRKRATTRASAPQLQ